jgi:hypothetical protein
MPSAPWVTAVLGRFWAWLSGDSPAAPPQSEAAVQPRHSLFWDKSRSYIKGPTLDAEFLGHIGEWDVWAYANRFCHGPKYVYTLMLAVGDGHVDRRVEPEQLILGQSVGYQAERARYPNDTIWVRALWLAQQSRKFDHTTGTPWHLAEENPHEQ